MGQLGEYNLRMDEMTTVDKRVKESREIATWFFGISIALMVISIIASVR